MAENQKTISHVIPLTSDERQYLIELKERGGRNVSHRQIGLHSKIFFQDPKRDGVMLVGRLMDIRLVTSEPINDSNGKDYFVSLTALGYQQAADAEILTLVSELEEISFVRPGQNGGINTLNLLKLETRLKELIRQAATALDSAHATQAFLLLAERYQWGERPTVKLFNRAVDLARKSNLKKEEALSVFGQGVATDAGGDEAGARNYYDTSLDLARNLNGAEKADFCNRAVNLADTLGDSALKRRVMELQGSVAHAVGHDT